MGRAVIAGAVVAVAAVIAVIFYASHRSAGPPLDGTVAAFAVLPPEDAPEITFSDAGGNTLTLEDFTGQVVLLNFWATWCGPCVREMPALDRLQADLGDDGLAVVALGLDAGGLDDIAPFFEQHALAALPVFLDPGYTTPSRFGVAGLPTTILIDRDGRVVGRLDGWAEWDSPEALALLRHYLDAAA